MTDRLRLYPDPGNPHARQRPGRILPGEGPEQVFVGVGSDDVLSMSFLTFFNSGKPILFPDITYSFYKVWAELYRIPYECCPLVEEVPPLKRGLLQGKRRHHFPESECADGNL